MNPNWEERFFVQHIREYSDSHLRKVLLIGGLRGTGKTVGILQALPLDSPLVILQFLKGHHLRIRKFFLMHNYLDYK